MTFSYTRVYATDDGESHIEDVAIDTMPTEVFPGLSLLEVSAAIDLSKLIFVGFPARARAAGWRRPPQRQFVIFGADIRVESSDGQAQVIRAGHPILFEDMHGRGHSTSILGDGETLALFLPIATDNDPGSGG